LADAPAIERRPRDQRLDGALQIRSFRDGSVVRMHMRLPDSQAA
jgi:hypothetical protein